MHLKNEEGLVKGAKVGRRGPEVTHLLFVDNCILFGETTKGSVSVLQEVLKEYDVCSKQCINFDKSLLFFSSNVIENVRYLVSQMLKVRFSSDPEKYLGLPNMVDKKKGLTDKLIKRLIFGVLSLSLKVEKRCLLKVYCNPYQLIQCHDF
ncbi:reverse transcriptase [Gossypium australe]|uniref:Reverse transcriptase n=1 Tax=Gossypium australe TaxID=47621 RepID=A0A5B6W8F9_9ROSI|nr:reverse transcriptase [Gossypium australe]